MRNTTGAILALAAALLAGVAFYEARQVRLARAALDTAVDERNALRDRVSQLEQAQQALSVESAESLTAEKLVAAPAPPAHATQIKTFRAAVPHGRTPGPTDAFDSPEMRRLMAIEQRGRLDARYATLFQALRLSPDQLDRLKQLLVDKQNAAMDVLSAAHRQDLIAPGSGADLSAMMRQEQDNVDAAIHDLLGATAYEEFRDFERTTAQRGLVEQLASRLSYTDNPLSPQQAEAMVDLLAAERSTQPAPTNPDPTTAGVRMAFAAGTSGDSVVSFSSMSPGGGAQISDTSLAGAQGVLSESQLAALRELQAEQQAQQQMGELMRRSMPVMTPAQGSMWIATPAEATTATEP